MNFIAPIILIAISIVIFFGYVDPNYKGPDTTTSGDYSTYGIKQLKDEFIKYEETLKNSTEVVSKRDSLIKKNNTIKEDDKVRLTKMLPDNIDNIRFILEITEIAAKRNLSIKNISIGGTEKTSASPVVQTVGSSAYGTLNLKFSINATYDNFVAFLGDLENNLRIVDINDISFNSNESGFYDFNVSLNAYWLK